MIKWGLLSDSLRWIGLATAVLYVKKQSCDRGRCPATAEWVSIFFILANEVVFLRSLGAEMQPFT